MNIFYSRLGFTCFLLSLAFAGFAQKNIGWSLMATHEIDYSLDYATVDMDSITSIYQAVKMNLKEGKINVYQSTVFFKDGYRQQDDHKYPVLEADGTRIYLKGNERLIDKIAIRFDWKDKTEDKSVVEFWGRK